MRLTWKLTIAIALGILLVLTLSAWVRVRADAEAYRQDTVRDHYVIGRGLATAVELLWSREGAERALALVERVNEQESRVAIRWVWPDEIAGPTAPLWRPALPLLTEAVHSMEVVTQGTHPYVITYVPVHLHGPRDGAIELYESSADEHELIRAALIRSAITTLVLIATCSGLILLFGVVFVARPLAQLISKADAIGVGELGSPLVLAQNDEIRDLAAAMNTMCERLRDARNEAQRQTEAREEAVEQLRHADRLRTIGELSTGLAHELGAPLNVVRVRGAMIGSGEVAESRMRELGAVIVGQADRMSTIIRQLLDFARREEPNRRVVDLRSVLRDALALVAPLSESMGILLDFAEPPSRVAAFVDPGQLQQAVANILVNAVHASTYGGVVTIHLDQSPAPEIVVTDSGVGIAVEHIPRIFDPFFTTKAAGVGTGLGLSVTAGIIQEHGGTISVQSELGKGSAFRIRLSNEGLRPSQYPTA